MEAAPQHQNALEEFKFKLLCHLQILPPSSRLDCKNPLKLVATCSGHGLIFVGTDVGFQCIQTNAIIALQNGRANNREKIASYPRYECNLGGPSTHLDVNSDGGILAVAYVEQNLPVLGFYPIESFGTPNAVKKWCVRLSSTPGTRVADAQWNPGISNMFGVVTTDGAAMVIDLTSDAYNINSIPPNSQSLCLSWSPKGKRVVIGSKGGSIIQYMPELKVVKAIPLPAGKNISVISLKWLSNTQYAAVLKDGQDPNGTASVVVINAPQNQPHRFINYDDICCGSLTDRPEHHFIHLPSWNLVILGSGNSPDSAVLKQNGDLWTQWIIDDGNRAELPLAEDHSDVYNIGMAIDFSPTHLIPVDENRKIEPAPLLLMYSHAGVLGIFHALNFTPGAPKLCIQPQELPPNYFVEKSSVGAPAAPVATPSAPAQNAQNTPMSSPFGMPSFGTSTFGMAQPAQPTQPTQSFQTPPPSQPSQLSFAPQSTAAAMPKTFSFLNASLPAIPKSTPNQQFGAFQQISQPQQPSTEQPLKSMFGATAPTTSSSTILNTVTTTKASFESFGFGSPGNDSAPKPAQVQSKPELPTYSQATQPPLPSASQPAPPPPPPDNITETKENEISAQDLELAQKQMDKAIVKALIKESKSVEKEFNDFKKKMSKFNMTVGKESEMNSIPAKVSSLEIFEQDLSETTSTQYSEVDALRCNLVEVYGWFENIKAKDRQIKSQRYIECLESQSLDPIVKKHLRSIEQHMHFFESQVKQATACLDSIWQNYNKSKHKNTIDIPNLESIYEVIVNQTYVLAAHKALFNEYQTKLHKILKYANKIPQVIEYSSPSYNTRTGISDLDVLADKLLNTKIDNKSPSKSYKETSCRYIVLANAKKNLPPSKENILKNWHKSHNLITTKATKPYILNCDDECLYESLTSEEESYVDKEVESVPKSSENSPQKVLANLGTAKLPPSVTVTKKPVADNIFGVKATSDNIKTDQNKSLGLMYEVVTTTAAPQKYSSAMTVQVGAGSAPIISPASISDYSSSLFANKTLPPTQFTTLASPIASQLKAHTVASQPKPPTVALQANVSTTVASQPKVTTVDSGVLNKPTPKTATTTATTKTEFSSLFGGGSSFLTSLSIPSLTKPTTTAEAVVSSTTSIPFSSSSSNFNSDLKPMSTPKTTASVPTLSFPISSLLSATKDVQESENAGKPSESANEFKTPEKTTQAETSLLLSALTSSVAISPAVSTTPATTSSLVSKSLFASPTNTPATATATATSTAPATTASIFGKNAYSSASLFTSSTTNVFGGNNFFSSNTITTTTPTATTEVVTSSAPSIFGGFGGMSLSTPASTTTVSSTTTSTPSAFTMTPTTQAPLFGGSSSVFGAATTSSQFSSANVFGSPSTTSASIFGGAKTTASLFGGTSTPAATAASVFGTPTTTASVFGTPTTTAASVFGAPTTTVASVFGSPTTTTASVFGTSTTAATSVFGTATTTATSLFGTPSTPATTASIFGAPATPTTTAAPLFGAPTSTVTTTASIFGAPTPSTTAASLFGAPSTPATTSTSIFGAPATPATAAASLFGAPSTTTSINQPIFGGAAATTSIFGNPSTVTTTTASVFGASQPSASSSFFAPSVLANAQTQQPFGAAQQTQPFGGSSFFQSTTPTANVFGGASTFGQTPTTTASSIFGGSPSFSQPTQSGNIFGNTSTPNKFASPSGSLFGGSSFASPQPQQSSFSSGQTGGLFGSSNAFQSNQSNVTQSGFGSPPAFGSSGSSIFGGQATFGSAPTFGGGATFGSPGKVFGESPTASAVSFGSPTQQSSTFENLANQNTISFGNLAQNQPTGFNSSFGSPTPPQQPAFANRPNTNTFGGSSFSSWR